MRFLSGVRQPDFIVQNVRRLNQSGIFKGTQRHCLVKDHVRMEQSANAVTLARNLKIKTVNSKYVFI